ncbi:MAG: hypothetical protein Q4F75_07340, partial [Pseudomonadota bacterium]|nr:hypothetical protein [Pseudomonadota bacterium]
SKNSPDFVRLEFSRGYESHKGQLGIITPHLTSPTLGEEYKEASVCFITDAGNCSGEKFSNDETPGSGGNGNPGSVPDYDTPQEQCQAAGYGVTSCPTGSHGDNPCPADSAYYQKCVCDANMTQTCTKPYYGVGSSCDGKYASCKRDDAKACKEDGFSQTTQCSSVQMPNKKCSYNSSYYDKCVCRSDLVSCTYPQTGVGEACGGKYASCQCPSSYKSCECGGAAGATSCTVNGVTTYSSCKACCTPAPSESNCACGTFSCYDGCNGSRFCCKSCSSSGSDSDSSGSGSDSGSSGSSGSGGYDCSCVGNQASPCPSSYYQKTNTLTCGATCYHCYRGVNQYRDVPRGSCYYSEASKRWILDLDLEKCCSSTGQCGILRGTSGRSFSSESECNATAASLPNSPLKPATNDYCDQAW